MPLIHPKSIAAQVAKHLRDSIQQGLWSDLMPGRDRLARDLGVAPNTVQRALEMLEHEGLLVSQGGGRRRRIVIPEEGIRPKSMRVGILPFDRPSMKMAFMVDLKLQLMEEGHFVVNMPKTLSESDMSVPRVARMVEKQEMDAWVVVAGTYPVVDWFAETGAPVFAYYGGRHSRAAGVWPNKSNAIDAAIDRLVALGHRRICFIVRPHNLVPTPGIEVEMFQASLESHGIEVSSYHLPLWEDSPQGLQSCLDALFAMTPPTALIIDEAELFVAARQYLADFGIVAPRDVSLISTDPDRAFGWSLPEVSHLSWGYESMVRRAVKWARNISVGREDCRKTYIGAKFVEGGTIGHCPR